MMAMESLSHEQDVRCLVLIAAGIQNLIKDLRGEPLSVHETEPKRRADKIREIRNGARGFVEDDSILPWSFLWMCHHLGADSEWFRAQVKNNEIMNWERAYLPVIQMEGYVIRRAA